MIKHLTYSGKRRSGINKLPEISVEDIFENKLSFLNKTQDYLYSRYFIVKKNPYCNFLVNDSIKDTWLYLLMKKVFPEAFAEGIEGVGLHPVRVNIA